MLPASFASVMQSASRDEFLAAMEELEGTPAMVESTMEPRTYLVLFDFDRSDIRPDGQAVIDQVLADAGAQGMESVVISATGRVISPFSIRKPLAPRL